MGHPVKIGHGQPVDLLADIGTHGVAHLGGDAGHYPALHVREQRTENIQTGQEQQDLADGRKINTAGAGEHGDHALKQLGGCLTQNLGSKDGEHRAAHSAQQRQHNAGQIAPHIGQQLFHGALEVLGFFAHGHCAGAVSHRSCHYANSSFES